MEPATKPKPSTFDIYRRRFNRHSEEWRNRLCSRNAQIAGFIATALLITSLCAGYPLGSLDSKIDNGIVKTDLVAPEDFVLVDQQATDSRREEATAQEPPVFEFDPGLREQVVSRFNRAFDTARVIYFDRLHQAFGTDEVSPAQTASSKYRLMMQELAKENPPVFSLSTDPRLLDLLARHNFSPELQKELANVLGMVLRDFIFPDEHAAFAQGRRLHYLDSVSHKPGDTRGRGAFSQSLAETRLRDSVAALYSLTLPERELAANMLASQIQPNFRFSPTLTEEARKNAWNAVPVVSTAYRRNQIIARSGEPVTPHIRQVVEYLKARQASQRPLHRFFGLLCIIAVLLAALHQFIIRSRAEIALSRNKAFTLTYLTVVTQTLLIWLGVQISQRFGLTMGMAGDLSPYEFAIPYAAAALVIALLLNENLALLCAVVVGVIAGLMTGGSIEISIFAISSGCAAAYGIGHYRQRNALTRAGAFVAFANVLVSAAVIFVGSNAPISTNIFLVTLMCSFIGGLIVAAYASFAVPISESLFGILTDVKLLELSNADLPVLRELAMHAPGTQQHSVMVGSLAQEAAEAIGANALLVRIGCYYHDIGKLMAPELFIENQLGGKNPHDTMDPRKSAAAVIGHVKKGLLMAREVGLPEEITDLIPQHHGTRKLHFFYNRALERAGSAPVNEADFRYPGPKPQTREAAVVMLADSAEAAARSLDDQSPEQIAGIVKRIVDDIIADGQLDECPLTMREIVVAREALIKTLCNIYHQRVVYPGFNSAAADAEEIGLGASNESLPKLADTAEPKTPTAAGTGKNGKKGLKLAPLPGTPLENPSRSWQSSYRASTRKA